MELLFSEDDQKALLMFPNCNEGITIIASDVEERDSWLKDVETQISRVLKEPVMFVWSCFMV